MLALLNFAGRNGPLLLFAGAFLGLLLPALASVARPLMGAAVFVFTFGAFTGVDSLDLRAQWAHPVRLALVLLWAGLGVPIAAWALLQELPLAAATKTGALLCMLAPPVGSAAAMAAMLRLNPALALMATIVVSLASPLLLPPAALALGAVELHIDALAMILRLAVLVLGAATLSAVLRRHAGALVGPSAQALTGISVVGLLVVAVGAMQGMPSQLALHGHDVVVALAAAFALNLGFQVLGTALFARWGPRDALTVGLISGNRNVTLVWVAAAPWLGDMPGVELYLAASVFPIFMLPLPISRLLKRWPAFTRIQPAGAQPMNASTIDPATAPGARWRSSVSVAAPERIQLVLAAGQHVCLNDAAGQLVHCRTGALWLTQEARFDDVTLCAGQVARLDQNGKTVVLAVRDSALAIEAVLEPRRAGVLLRAWRRCFGGAAEAGPRAAAAPFTPAAGSWRRVP